MPELFITFHAFRFSGEILYNVSILRFCFVKFHFVR